MQGKEVYMIGSTGHEKVNVYGAYPLGVAEQMVRGKMTELFDRIIRKNEICLAKARDMGLEKLMSRILAVKKRMARIRKEMAHTDPGAEYKYDPLPENDLAALKDLDKSLESLILDCISGIESLTCMETDLHISDRFAMMDNGLREIERLLRRRNELFKKMRVFG